MFKGADEQPNIAEKDEFYRLLDDHLAVDDLLLLKVQIQNLTLINAQFGHEAGDKIIAQVQQVLLSLRMVDVIGKISISLYGLISRVVADPNKVYEELSRAVQKLNESSASPYLIDLAVGMVLMPAGSENNVHNWTNKADKALVVSARTGQPVIYDESIERDQALRLELGRLTHSSKQPNGMHWVFQPVVDLVTREILGFETLVRWDLDGFGPVSPAIFVPIAEELGSIGVLDLWALKAAVTALPILIKDDHQGLGVNASAVTIERDRAYLDALREYANAGLFAKNQVVIEITETSIVRNINHTENQLQKIIDLGLFLAVDDFGKGETNFGILSRLSFAYLKLDAGLLRLGSGKSQAQILAIAQQVGQVLGADVLQEGIESEQDLEAVLASGITRGQGWLLGMPQALEYYKK